MQLFEEIRRNHHLFVVIVLFALLYLISTSITFLWVFGHASPAIYFPQPNQIFNSTSTIPDEVTITFDERLELNASTIRVTNYNNTTIDNKDIKLGNSEKELRISLNKSKLLPGEYLISWFVLSKDDGLITKGSYNFSYIQ